MREPYDETAWAYDTGAYAYSEVSSFNNDFFENLYAGFAYSFTKQNGTKKPLQALSCKGFSGAKGIRTPDLYNANVARYQLCYSPLFGNFSDRILHLVGFRCFRGGSAQVVVRSTSCANAPFGKISDQIFHRPLWSGQWTLRRPWGWVSWPSFYQLCYSPIYFPGMYPGKFPAFYVCESGDAAYLEVSPKAICFLWFFLHHSAETQRVVILSLNVKKSKLFLILFWFFFHCIHQIIRRLWT